MKVCGEEAKQAITVTGDEEFQRSWLRCVFLVLIESARTQLERVSEGTNVKMSARVHEMNAHGGQVGILAVLLNRIVRSKKASAQDNAVQSAEDEQPICDFAAADHDEGLPVRIRGSSQYRRMSARKFPATRTIVENNTPPTTT